MTYARSAPTTTRVSVALFGAFEFVFGAFAFANRGLFRAESFANTEPESTGLEPATFAVTGRRSNQLSYDSKKLSKGEPTVRIELTIQLLQSRALPLGYAGVEPEIGFEPMTYGLQNRCTTTVLFRHVISYTLKS